MSVDKYPSIFSHQMVTIVYIFFVPNGGYCLQVYHAVLCDNFAHLQHNELHCVCDEKEKMSHTPVFKESAQNTMPNSDKLNGQ